MSKKRPSRKSQSYLALSKFGYHFRLSVSQDLRAVAGKAEFRYPFDAIGSRRIHSIFLGGYLYGYPLSESHQFTYDREVRAKEKKPSPPKGN